MTFVCTRSQVAAWLGLSLLALAAHADADAPADAKDILNNKTWLRWRLITRDVACVSDSAKEPTGLPKATTPLSPNPDATPPPAGWTDPSFDDSSWPRSQLSPGSVEGTVTDGDLMFIGSFRTLMRARFNVANTADVRDLTLGELRFDGGIIVWLNGREIAREGMPAGNVSDTTAALQYPDDVWLGPDGGPIPDDLRRMSDGDREECSRRKARRTRSLAPLVIPSSQLRKGVNVLAIEVRRSDSHPKASNSWSPINLDRRSFRLTASGSGVEPNISRPTGLRVWVEDINDRVGEHDWSDPCEPPGTVRIAGARNGAFGGLLVVAKPSELKGLRVDVSNLIPVESGAPIPASSADVLSARLDGEAYSHWNWFDGLQPGVPSETRPTQFRVWAQPLVDDASMVPIYIRLRIPRDAQPGSYRGAVSVCADGEQTVRVPVAVSVSAYTLPDPKDFRAYVGLYQSPTSVAMQYKVREWSEDHWKLLDKSFALLARVGNKMVNLPVVEHTQFGNEEGMVHWVKKPDGSYDHDFTVFDRFLDTARGHLGTLDYVALQVWHSGGWETRSADQENTVTVVDRAAGTRTSMQVPVFGTPESKAFWKPVLEACRVHLASRGLEKAMCIGILSDGTAPREVFAAFDEIWPGGGPARWTRGLHSACGTGGPYKLGGGGVCVLHEHCYGSPMHSVNEPITGLASYRGMPATAYFRYSGFETLCNVQGYRLLTDQAIFLRKQGIGRIGFDFWGVISGRRDSDAGRTIYNRYPYSSCAQRAPALYSLSWPGPDGAGTTQRFELLCQGVQETEAMIAISDALDRKDNALEKDLADRCRRVLYDRLWVVTTRPIISARWATMANHVNHYGWQDLARRTFDCAAEVSRRLPASTTRPAQE